MKRFIQIAVISLCVALVAFGCIFQKPPETSWEVKRNYNQFISGVLTITTQQGADTSAVFEGSPNMTITLIPYGTANYDSFHGGGADSCNVDVIVEGLSGPNGATANVIGYARVFNPWRLQSYGKVAQRDSAYRKIDTALNDSTQSGYTLQQFFNDYTAGTGSWDSTRVDLVDIKNTLNKPFWPYCRVIVKDNEKKTGKNWAGKVIVYGTD